MGVPTQIGKFCVSLAFEKEKPRLSFQFCCQFSVELINRLMRSSGNLEFDGSLEIEVSLIY